MSFDMSSDEEDSTADINPSKQIKRNDNNELMEKCSQKSSDIQTEESQNLGDNYAFSDQVETQMELESQQRGMTISFCRKGRCFNHYVM